MRSVTQWYLAISSEPREEVSHRNQIKTDDGRVELGPLESRLTKLVHDGKRGRGIAHVVRRFATEERGLR